MARGLFSGIAMFVGGFAVSCVAIAMLVGDPLRLYAQERSEKLAVLSGEGPQICSASFGSSHVNNGLDPRVFDATLGAHGINIKSVNLAINGGSQTEQFAMVREFMRTRRLTNDPARHCLIVQELTAGANFLQRHLVNPRAINIYDVEVARLGFVFAAPNLPFGQRAGRMAFVSAATAMHYLNVGTLASFIFPHENDSSTIRIETIDDRRGLEVEPPIERDAEMVASFFATSHSAGPAVDAKLQRGSVALIAAEKAMSGGARFDYVYLVAPKLGDLDKTEAYPDCIVVGETSVSIINVAKPDLYPSLYRRSLWHDPNHFNEAGAAEFSRFVAEELARTTLDPSKRRVCVTV